MNLYKGVCYIKPNIKENIEALTKLSYLLLSSFVFKISVQSNTDMICMLFFREEKEV